MYVKTSIMLEPEVNAKLNELADKLGVHKYVIVNNALKFYYYSLRNTVMTEDYIKWWEKEKERIKEE